MRQRLKKLLGPLCNPFTSRWRLIAFAISSAALSLLLPLTARLSPTVQEYLKKKGLRAEVATELAPGKTIYVRDGLAARTERAFFLHNFLPHGRNVTWFNKFTAHLAFPSLPLFAFNIAANSLEPIGEIKNDLFDENTCLLAISNAADLGKGKEGVLALTVNIPLKYIDDTQLRRDEIAAYVLFHEIAHCGDKYNSNRMSREGIADLRGATTAARELNNPEIIRWVFNWRAARMPSEDDPTHDVTLFLSDKLAGKEPPAVEILYTANAEAGKFLDGVNSIYNLAAAPGYDKLSPLARKRVELYVEGQKYFIKQ